MATTEQGAPEQLVARLEELLGSLEEIGDPKARDHVEQVMGTLLEMYGVGMQRILRIVESSGQAADHIKREMADDGVVASLMLIHGLYPVPLADRVEEALVEVRPLLATHQGDVELLDVTDGVARLRLKGSCDGCPASALTLESLIREALEAAAPDLEGLEVLGVVPPPGPRGPVLPSAPVLDLPMVQVGAAGYTECPSSRA